MTTPAITTEAEALEAFKAGASLPTVAKALGIQSCATLRYRFIKAVGGLEAWQQIVAARPTEGRRMPPPLTVRAPATDEGVPVIRGAPTKAGWRSRRWHGTDIFTSPEGVQYVMAQAWERAALIVEPSTANRLTAGLPAVRLKVFNEEKAEQKIARKEAKQNAREAARHQRKSPPPWLALPCPTCQAEPGHKCKRPSGHATFGGEPHAARRDAVPLAPTT